MAKFTDKQKSFIDVYDGDIKKASCLSGLSYSYCRQLMTLEKHAHVVEAIKSRERTKSNRKIKTREERQEWWSKMMDTAEKDSDKLKASELLGKSEADFTDNHTVNADVVAEVAHTSIDIDGAKESYNG